MLLFILTLLLPLVKLDHISLTRFPIDTILGIPPGESYSDIRVLVDLSVCVTYTNKLSSIIARETGAELTISLA